MSKFDPLKAEVASVTTVIDSAVALIGGLAGHLQAAIASEDVAGEVQAIVADLEASRNSLANAVAANTIADPAPVADSALVADPAPVIDPTSVADPAPVDDPEPPTA